MSAVITATALSVGYGGRAVATVDRFQAGPEQITVIVGPNGSGKTTLLKTLAGLLPAVAGAVLPMIPPGEGGAIFVHSTPVLFAGTAGANMLISSRDQERARRQLRRLHVEDLWARDVRRLSSGQRQRIALARALAARPRLLLLDEPAAGLDDASIDDWQVVLGEAIDAGNPTIVLATHSMAAVETLPFHLVHLSPPAADRSSTRRPEE